MMFPIRALRALRAFAYSQKRPIAHLSPLADAFNHVDVEIRSHNSGTAPTGLFGDELLNSPLGFEQTVNRASMACSELLHEALSPARTRKMVKILDDMSDSLCRAADLADCIRILHPDADYRQHALLACEVIGGLVEKLNTNPELYAAAVHASHPNCPFPDRSMDHVDKRVLDLLIADFELSGVQLKDPVRQTEFVRAANEAMRLGSDFAQASHTPVTFRWTDPRSGSQQEIRLLHPLVENPNPELREASYRAFFAPIRGQEERLLDLLDKRHRMACAAGFNQFTDRTTLHSLASSTGNTNVFLESVCKQLSSLASQTALQHLVPFMSTNYGVEAKYDRLEPWDVGFALGVRRQLFQVDDLTEYFSLGACMEGVSQLADCLFGLRLRVESVQPGETWHPSVIKVGVFNSDSNDLVGLVYCDVLDRPGKPAQDCHYTIRGGRCLEHGEYQKPIITLQLTLDPPSIVGRPPLLSPGQVENLFHEWGHALHSMLARTRYQHVTGTRCSTDLAEIPSTLFEHFALDPRVTKEYARHWRTGAAPGKQELEALERLSVGGHLGCSVELIQQTTYAMLDQVLHSGHPDVTLRPHDSGRLPASCHLLSFIQSECGLSDWLVCDPDHLLAWPHRFTHLVGYAGRYYSYMMAKAGAELIWQNCFANDPWSSSSGRLCADELLRHGGEFSPIHMLTNLLTSCDSELMQFENTLSPEQLAGSLVTQLGEHEYAAARLLSQLLSPGLHQPRFQY